jgi:hypothetical protein
MGAEGFPLGKRGEDVEAYYSRSSRIQVKKKWNYTPTITYAYTAFT